MSGLCFICRDNPAGSPGELRYSAYCPGCRPARVPEPEYAFYGCGACCCMFGTLASFDEHQAVRCDCQPVITCRVPAALGLIRDDHGVWQTPGGLAARERKRQTMAGWNRVRRQDASSRPGVEGLPASQGIPV